MAEDNFTLTTFYRSWQAYQDHLTAATAALTTEQLALRPAPGLRSVGENALHIVGCRMFWLTEVLGEDGGEALKAYVRWNEAALGAPYATPEEAALALGAPLPTGAELAQGLDCTWRLLAECLARWSAADMRQTFGDDDNGGGPDGGDDGADAADGDAVASRAWVVWHVLEHDLHHGGEISLALGIHGIPAEFAV